MDLTSYSAGPLEPRTTTPGSVYLTPGGVGRNVAEAAHNLLEVGDVKLVSALGAEERDGSPTPDAVGDMILREMEIANMRADGLFHVSGKRSAACTLVLEGNMDLVNGIADMGVVEAVDGERVCELNPYRIRANQQVERLIEQDRPEIVVFDCNMRPEVIRSILAKSGDLGIPSEYIESNTLSPAEILAFCDPTSTPKLPRLATTLTSLIPPDPSRPRPLTHIAPNVLELDLLYSLLTSDNLLTSVQENSWAYINSLNLGAEVRAKIENFTNTPTTSWIRSEGIITKTISCLPFIESFWIKSGSRGLIHISLSSSSILGTRTALAEGDKLVSIPLGTGKFLNLAHFAAKPIAPEGVVSTTGAGDTLSGGIVAGLIGKTKGMRESGRAGNEYPIVGGAVFGEGNDLSFVYEAMRHAEKSIKSRRAVG